LTAAGLYFEQRKTYHEHYITRFDIPPGISRYMRRYTPLYRLFPYFIQYFPVPCRQPVLYGPDGK
jgi:hypothetical protein